MSEDECAIWAGFQKAVQLHETETEIRTEIKAGDEIHNAENREMKNGRVQMKIIKEVF
jgi:hypothetical protein